VPVREVRTASADETEALGAALGRAAIGGELLGLIGDLGAGKTCLVRGLAAGLGIDPAAVHSPTFTIVTEYAGGRLPLAHVDLYRLAPGRDDTGFLRDVLYGPGVAAVEWFDRLATAADEDEALVVHLDLGAGDRRVIRLEARGARHVALLARALG
jgi:tRNA threonylcarbamoyladenosine biosynthesis protein TsaE